MTEGRRVVRAMVSFFEDLDRQLPPERQGHLPSIADFQAYELLRIVERFAVDFEGLPELIPGRQQYRLLVSNGVLVRAVSVVGQLAVDGAVELVQLGIDTTPLPSEGDPA